MAIWAVPPRLVFPLTAKALFPMAPGAETDAQELRMAMKEN